MRNHGLITEDSVRPSNRVSLLYAILGGGCWREPGWTTLHLQAHEGERAQERTAALCWNE